MQVLKSIDLAAIKFPVLIAENNGGSDAIENFLLGEPDALINAFACGSRSESHSVRYKKVRNLAMDIVFVHSK